MFSGVFAVNTLGGKHVIPSRKLTYPTWGKGKSLQNGRFRGYISSQEGNLNSSQDHITGFLQCVGKRSYKNHVCTMAFMCIMSCNMICTVLDSLDLYTFGYVMGGRFGEGFPI